MAPSPRQGCHQQVAHTVDTQDVDIQDHVRVRGDEYVRGVVWLAHLATSASMACGDAALVRATDGSSTVGACRTRGGHCRGVDASAGEGAALGLMREAVCFVCIYSYEVQGGVRLAPS